MLGETRKANADTGALNQLHVPWLQLIGYTLDGFLICEIDLRTYLRCNYIENLIYIDVNLFRIDS